jgi:hypothetical protein
VQQVAKIADVRRTGRSAAEPPERPAQRPVRVSHVNAAAFVYGAQPSFETLPSLERWLSLRASNADLPV